MASKIVPGLVFGKLTVLSREGSDGKVSFWSCRCECGTVKTLRSCNLLSGSSKSCGCFKAVASISHGYTVGGKVKSGYHSYRKMLSRCLTETDISYKNYGAKGVTVCPEWQGVGGFTRFIAHVGPKPFPHKEFSLDRIDPNGNYEPGNVRWATRQTQNRNKKTAVTLTVGGETLHISEWAERLGVKTSTLAARKLKGWTDERVVFQKVRKTSNGHPKKDGKEQ